MVDDAAGPNPRRTDPGDPLNPHEPRSIGPYALVSRLGVGGMGTVYLARNTAGRRVAVKVIRPDLAADEEFRRRFRAEVEAARRVAPFCTAEVLDADPNAPAPYLVTEFIDGVRLDEQVESGPLASSTLTGLAVGVATALTAIHSAGLVHRDLKPSNVMLSLSGPRVIDFGIAQALEGAKAKPTAWGFGSAGWMAPEQVHGQPIGPEADVFAWGILIAYAGTGRHPFGDGSDIEIGMRIVGSAPDLRGLREPLVGLVSAALAKHPDDRPSARELLLRLVAQPPARGGPALGPAIGQVEELLNRTGEVPRPAPTRVGPATSAPARRPPWDGAPAVRPATAVPPGRAPAADRAPGAHGPGPAPVGGPANSGRPRGTPYPATAGPPGGRGPAAGPGARPSPDARAPSPPDSRQPDGRQPDGRQPDSRQPAAPSGRQPGGPAPGTPPAARWAGPGGQRAPGQAPGPGPQPARMAEPARMSGPARMPAPARVPEPARVPGPAPMPGAADTPYPPYPPSAPPRRGPDRRQLALIVGVVVAALIAIAVVVVLPGRGGGADAGRPPGSTATVAGGASVTSSPTPTAGLGLPATDGRLEFVVAGIDCSKSRLGDGLLALRASGRFCLAQVTVRNTGDTAAALDNTTELLWDDHGDRHEANFLARFKLDENLWDSIDPGETKRGTLVFDVPRDAQPQELELHESAQSDGVRIPVR
ncbi:DUF4352 domain-containing protein [Frankia sp. AvcI1]|uniref:protein kinase domain-containing protein n=2 Tax=unclassified Frankia TaxID=2632575 RepID=UPI001F2B4DDC|nr:DUF4352 domain-containing protein [Frankia sp. AvcI1]